MAIFTSGSLNLITSNKTKAEDATILFHCVI